MIGLSPPHACRPMPVEQSPSLIAALRAAAEPHGEVDERLMFGCRCILLNGKICFGVREDDLLVRLPPDTHETVAESPAVRELDPRGGMRGYFWVEPAGYATRAQWEHWVAAALAYNPLAKASPRRNRQRALGR